MSPGASDSPRPPGRLVRVGGQALHVVVEPGPADAVPVVLASGLGGAWYDWDPVVPLLAGHAPVLRFDRPGLGWSEPSAVPPTLAGEAERIRALLTTPGVLGPGAGPAGRAVLVGFSLAGFHVEAFARLHPELTAGLVLVDGSAEPDPPAPEPPELAERRLAQWRILGDLAARSGFSRFATPAVRALAIRFSRTGGADLAERSDVAATAASGRLLTATLLENATYHAVAAQLLELRCEKPFPEQLPLRVIAAFGATPAVRALPFAAEAHRRRAGQWRSRQRELAALSLRGKLIEITDSAHYVAYDRPDAVAEAVREVLAELV
ncbi:MAG TPA: alpha/beta hydrolase [Actinospica sp.]|jgi:pimeloyl-ACP methyl ester carboxylesterase|nr:alpha/beta hydrolase [Actinospica sp.]